MPPDMWGFTTITPQGDGNMVVKTPYAVYPCEVSRPLPRKGTETRSTISQIVLRGLPKNVSRPLPRKGTETLQNQLLHRTFQLVSRPLPRKGTETDNASGENTHCVRVGRSFTTITPQGDGNLVVNIILPTGV